MKSWFFRLVLLFSGALSAFPLFAQDPLTIGRFSEGDLDHWQSKRFKGVTDYQLVKLSGVEVLRAVSENSASGLFKKQRIDLRKTPYLNWRWRVETRLGGLDEQSKAGDDYAARLYVVISGGWAFWRTRSINYVWASTSPVGQVWPNAFAGDNVVMIALRSGTDKTGTWYHEKRNVLDDLRRYLGDLEPYLDAVALMTDTDNAHGRATAYYGDIYFTED